MFVCGNKEAICVFVSKHISNLIWEVIFITVTFLEVYFLAATAR